MRAETVVAHLVGVQAQLLRAAGLALAARTDGLTEDAVTAARVDDRSIALTWAMRGTLHLVAADDVDRLVPFLTEPHKNASLRRLRQESVSADQAERACDLIADMLAREGPLTRGEIAARLRRRRIRTEGQAIAYLLWLAGARRGLCFGPDRGGDRTFVLARDWIDVSSPRDRADRDGVLRELALRYLRSHAPATADDLAAWSGIRIRDARRAWAAIARHTREIRTPNGAMEIPRSRFEEAPGGHVRVLPDLDEYLLGWRDRGFAVPVERARYVNAGGGFVRPVVLRDGRVVATWSMDRTPSRTALIVRLFAPPSASLRSAVLADAARLGAFVGAPVDVSFGEAGRA
jgi:hypothetical protein